MNVQTERSGLLLGRYELVAELASGGMATVFLARAWGDAGFERWCAIKKLHPHLANEREYIEMFIDEARLAGSIHHPNVIETLAAGRDDVGSHFLVMQYVVGQHLAALIRNVMESKRRIPPPLALRIGLDALAGLSAAHGLHDDDGQPLCLVHRDISPHNILVGADGVARLTDFGIAKAEGRLHSTRSNVVKGKLAYMSPEQLSGRPVDQRADVFAMGIVIWEALTHRRLFAYDDPAEIFRRVLVTPIPKLSSVRRELRPLDAVLAKALSRDPEDRYASASELARALEQAAPAVGGIASPRAVAKLVEVLAEEKLAAERSHIENASPRPLLTERPAPRSRTQTRDMRMRPRGSAGGTGSGSEPAPVVSLPPVPPHRAAPRGPWLSSAALVLLAVSLGPLIASDRVVRSGGSGGEETLVAVESAPPHADVRDRSSAAMAPTNALPNVTESNADQGVVNVAVVAEVDHSASSRRAKARRAARRARAADALRLAEQEQVELPIATSPDPPPSP